MARDTRILTLQLTMRRAAVFAAIALCAALYLADLTGMGMYGPDEPRYADIGRAMAHSGDWITPHLWGRPWFEKPPLLYWMTAAGFESGLGEDLAPRLPVALLGVAFLAFFWFRTKRIWDTRAATCSTAILATTAGWLAYSHVGVTDVPVAVFFTAAVLFTLDPKPRRTSAAFCLGLATLAKSLPPLILFLPVLALDYRRWREWLRPGPLISFACLTVPWHILCAARNGYEFVRVLFLEHQFGRFTSAAMQHGQRWWYYIPVLPILLFPWFPLFVLAPRNLRDRRVLAVTAVIVFGLIFFSASVNKLPGYLLPLLPCACILMGVGLARLNRPGYALVLPLVLASALLPAARMVPMALERGLRAVQVTRGDAWLCVAAACVAVCIVFALGKNGVTMAASVVAVAWLWFQFAAFPAFDAAASARPLWRAHSATCAPTSDRKLLYGLYYYAGGPIPECAEITK